MSRYLLAIGTCAMLAASADASPHHGITINVADATGAEDAHTSVQLIKRRLAARLAKASCDGCHIDASVSKLSLEANTKESAIVAEVNIALSDGHGRMVSVLAGRARAVTSRSVRPSRLAALRAEAVIAAVDGMSIKLAHSLARAAPASDTWFASLFRGWTGAPLPTS